MPVIKTHELLPGQRHQYQDQIYNGLDSALTLEIFNEVRRTHNDTKVYDFERALQAPILDMMVRGFKVDEYERQRAVAELNADLARVYDALQRLAKAVWDKELNPRSSDQLKKFFYGAMKLPEVWTSKKGVRSLSMDREALEKLDAYFYAQPMIACILSFRDLAKLRDIIKTEVDSDGRWRSSYNIGGTECISGDSLVWTKSGLRTIEEIYNSPYKCSVWNGNAFVIPVAKVKYENIDGFQILLENGYTIKCSTNHPLLTRGGWKEARQLNLSDELQINIGLPVLFGQHALSTGAPIELLSEDLCEFIGMWLADGSLNCNTEHYRCRLSNSKTTVQERFIELAKSLFGVEAKSYGEEVYFSSKLFCSWFKSIGMLADSGLGTASHKTIPSIILRGKPNLLRALLRGLTLDSHQTKKGVMFGTQSKIMQDQIQQCLLILGISSVKVKTGNSIKLNIPRAYCGRFLSTIGFVQSSKAESLARLLNQRCQWHEPIVFGSKPFLTISSIEVWHGDVFDLTMPESSLPQYVAQGFTVHNTGRLSSSKSAWGTGSNTQNLKRDDDIDSGLPSIRRMFIADRGYKLCNIDLEQTESFDVGWLQGTILGDWRYLDACEDGDLHSQVARMVWPELPWTGRLSDDRAIADRSFYRHFTYRDMAKRGGHLCLTEDHEVLTPCGWVPIADRPIQIMTWKDGWSGFLHGYWTDELYDGELHEFIGNSVSLQMTDNHKVPYKSNQNRGKTLIRKASTGPGTFMPLGDNYMGGCEDVPARLIAAFMSDGNQKSINRMEFHLRKERKISRLKYLCELYGFKYDYNKQRERFCVHGSLPKRAGAFMFEWTAEALRDFLDEYKHWDGHISETAVSLCSIDREHLEWIQTLGRILGIGGAISSSTIKSSFSGSSKIYTTTLYRLQQNNRRWASGKCVKWTKRRVKGVRVLCPTVPTGFFYVRRNGKICITGNSNYMGTAWTASRSLRVPLKIMERFQSAYALGDSAAFPAFPKWWRWVAEQLQTEQRLTTPFGRERHFFGRPRDDTTLREAIAFVPQSCTADRMNLGMWRIWRKLHDLDVQLLAQVHDSVCFQFPETADENEIVQAALALTRVEQHHDGRMMCVNAESKLGWNWGNFDAKINPDGMKKFKLNEKDVRLRRSERIL